MPVSLRFGVRSLEKGSTPSPPPAGSRDLYPKSDGWYEQTSGSVETKIGPPAPLATAVTNTSINTVYPDNTSYYRYVLTSDSFPVNGMLSGVRIGTNHAQRLQDTVTGDTYARAWNNGGSAWTAWIRYIDAADYDVKGDLLVGTGADAFSRLASSGTAGEVLTVDTTTGTGLKWAPASASGSKISALGAAAALTGVETFPVVQSGVTVKATIDQHGTYYKTKNAVNNASVSTPGAGFAADTYLVGSSCAVPATSGLGSLTAKTQYRAKFHVSKTGAGVAAPTINVRFGTAGAIGDTSRCLITFPAQTAVIDEGLFEVFVTFRTVGSGTTAVIVGVGTLVHRLSITGLSTGVSPAVVTVGGGFDSTVAASIIGLSVNGATSAAWTIAMVQAELYNLA